MHVFSDKVVKAKKQYRCDASDLWKDAGLTHADCSTDEQRIAIERARADGWRILPGQRYRQMTGIDDRFFTYRARLDMDRVCFDLDMWED